MLHTVKISALRDTVKLGQNGGQSNLPFFWQLFWSTARQSKAWHYATKHSGFPPVEESFPFLQSRRNQNYILLLLQIAVRTMCQLSKYFLQTDTGIPFQKTACKLITSLIYWFFSPGEVRIQTNLPSSATCREAKWRSCASTIQEGTTAGTQSASLSRRNSQPEPEPPLTKSHSKSTSYERAQALRAAIDRSESWKRRRRIHSPKSKESTESRIQMERRK